MEITHITPILSFKTGLLTPRMEAVYPDMGVSQKDYNNLSAKLRVIVVCVRNKDSISGLIETMTDQGTFVYEDKFVYTTDTDLEAIKRRIYLNLNYYYLPNYTRAMIIFDGETYDAETYRKIINDWDLETEKLLFSVA